MIDNHNKKINQSFAPQLSEQKIDLDLLKNSGKVFSSNASCSILDIGDDVALIEFHTKANSLNDEICDMLIYASQEGSRKFNGFVIGNYGKHFSAGANLAMVLQLSRDQKWNVLENTIRKLQGANMAMKYCEKPIVAAPFSNTLGGGCEVCLHSTLVVLESATHMGLVETGVGLIPGGGGTKELGLRAMQKAILTNTSQFENLKKASNHILLAKVSANGDEAKELFLTEDDVVVSAATPPISIAKEGVLQLSANGYKGNENKKSKISVLGSEGIRLFGQQTEQLLSENKISEHDALIASLVANILCGGQNITNTIDEQGLLDLECEAFLHLAGTQKTQERIAYLLENNKPLRN